MVQIGGHKMGFPEDKIGNAADYATGYFECMVSALRSVKREEIHRAAAILNEAVGADRLIFSCGNGGSAAIANHLVCDCGKGMRADTALLPRVFSLSNSIEMITAIGNDIAFPEIFAFQLRGIGRPGDVLITISSSGDSENIVRAIDWARANGMKTIAMTGFGGGRSAKMADVTLHVAENNYGVVEDIHQSIMHILAQYLRHAEMEPELIKARNF
jgi:D-sedoheptulose 7-phosphate isomerase